MKALKFILSAFLVASAWWGCMESDREPRALEVPVVTDGSGLSAFESDECFGVEISTLIIAVKDFEFTTGGDTHVGFLEKLFRLIEPAAYAHPGHLAGGEVIGEMPGDFILEPTSGEALSMETATLLEGSYNGMNFTFRKAAAGDGFSAGDPILGHTAYMEGEARKGGKTYAFSAVVDVDEGTKMVGAPFTLELKGSAEGLALAVKVLASDPSAEADTLLDRIDFEQLDEDEDGQVDIRPGDDAHNVLKRRIQVHDHYWVEPVWTE